MVTPATPALPAAQEWRIREASGNCLPRGRERQVAAQESVEWVQSIEAAVR